MRARWIAAEVYREALGGQRRILSIQPLERNRFCYKPASKDDQNTTTEICEECQCETDTHTHTHIETHTHMLPFAQVHIMKLHTGGRAQQQYRAELSVRLTDCWVSLPLELFYKHYNGPPIGKHCIPGMLTCLSIGWLQNHNLLSLTAC